VSQSGTDLIHEDDTTQLGGVTEALVAYTAVCNFIATSNRYEIALCCDNGLDYLSRLSAAVVFYLP